MQIIAGTVTIDPETYEEFMSHARVMMDESRAEEGCHAYVFTQDGHDPSIIRLYELWEDADALAAHAASEHMAAWRAAAGGLVKGRSLQLFDVTNAQPLP